jgi:catechol 2,3-dioxygenase-like lactoylglutathione lyase family enzyme
MSAQSIAFRCVKVIALPVLDLERANKFYGETLSLPPAYEENEKVGYMVGETILMLKADLDQAPTQTPNPRVTVQTDDARETEKNLRSRDVTISDPVAIYDKTHCVGSFLDTEGNKVWFCSYGP